MKYFFTTVLFLTLVITRVCAQVYPVQSALQITPPYSVNLPDYVAVGSERMALNVILTDISRTQLDAQLRVTIEGQGIRIETNPNYMPPRLSLLSGFNSRLIAADLEPYFRPENLIFKGMSSRQYVNSGGALPEGVYRFCFEVLEYNRNVKISNTTCVTAWLILNDPPMINLPKMAEKLEPSDPQYIRFQWTPRHTGSPNSAFSTEYDFELVEIWPKGRNPNDAMLTTAPIYETTTFATTLIYGPAEPALVRGRQYAFRVQAKSKVGIEQMDLFRNDGYSEVFTFTYGDECVSPDGLTIEASSRKLQTSWDDDGIHSGYVIRYRQQGDDEWSEESVLFNELIIEGLLPDTYYDIQLAGTCGFTSSAFTDTERVKTEAEIDSDFACGTPPDEFNLDNTNPLPSLKRGDVIKAGDFDVSLLEVSGGNGTFSGTGQLVMPMMNNVKMGTAFTGIKVNDEYRMYDGSMNFTGLTVQALTDEQLDDINDLLDDVADLGEDIDDILDFSEEAMDSINAIVEEIQNTDVFTEDEYADIISEEMDADDLQEEAKEAAHNAVAAVASGNIMEAAKQVAKSKAIKKRADLKRGQAANMDTAQTVAVEFVSGGVGLDQGPGHLAIEPNYFKIETADGQSHYGPWFSINAGQSATIIANWVQDSQVPKDEITFTYGGQDIQAESTDGGWELTLTAADPLQGQVLKALHEGNTVGIAAAVTYSGETRNVVLVSVNNEATPSAGEAEDYLNDIFGSAMVDWKVTTASVTIDDSWDLNGNNNLYLGENNDLSTYTDEAKAMIRLVKEELSPDSDKYYMLYTKADNSLDFGGYMPRKKQYGFMFDSELHTLAHELGHGAFRLAHTWEEFPNLDEGETENIMDYSNGTLLRKYQWDQIHDPKWVISLFDDEEEGAIAGKYCFSPDWKIFRIDADITRTVAFGSVWNQIPNGTAPGFKIGDKTYYAVFEQNDFKGYYLDGEPSKEEYAVQYFSNESVDADPVYLFRYVDGCGSNIYYQTNLDHVQEFKNTDQIFSEIGEAKLITCHEDVEELLFEDLYLQSKLAIGPDGPIHDFFLKIQKIVELYQDCIDESFTSYEGKGIVPYCLWKGTDISAFQYYGVTDRAFIAGVIDGGYQEVQGILDLVVLLDDAPERIYEALVAYAIWQSICESGVKDNIEERYREVLDRLASDEELHDNLIANWIQKEYDTSRENILSQLSEYVSETCDEQEKIIKPINEFFGLISTLETYQKLWEEFSIYLEELNATTNEARYKHGLLVVPVVSSFVPLAGQFAKVAKLDKWMDGLRALTKTNKDIIGRLVVRSERLGLKLDGLPSGLLKKFDEIVDDDILRKLIDDIDPQTGAQLRIKLIENPALVNAWKVADDAGVDDVLRKNINHLTTVDDFIKAKGINPDVLKNELQGLSSHQDEFLKGLKISNKGNTLDLFPKIKMDDLPISSDGSVMGRYVDGVLEVSGNTQVAGKWDYIVKANGEIVVGRKHSFMSQGSDVLAAGELKFSNGKLVDINNLSGHYVPDAGETFNFLRVFKSNGVNVGDATLSIYKGSGDIFSQVPPSATKRVLYE
ncbi:MAG: hypothetical protein GY816_19375 [Cytophagales bacterium]|nr:hypothetical protein [Cytophagales bacterium]